MDATECNMSPVTTPSLLGNEMQQLEMSCDEYVNFIDEILRGSVPEVIIFYHPRRGVINIFAGVCLSVCLTYDTC